MVKINGVQKDVAGMTLNDYLESEHYNLKRVAVECNGDIVPKAQYPSFVLKDEYEIEVVSFVGGG